MIRSFAHKGLERFFLFGIEKGISPAHAKRLRLILSRLQAAVDVSDMALPGLRIHGLHGDRKGFYAVDVSGNWRVVFRFEGRDAVDVTYVDYH